MTFHASYRGIGEMISSPFMVEAMRARAERAKVYAEVIAPVYEGSSRDDHRGRYKASFSVEAGVRQHRTRRAYGRLLNDSPEAFFVEYGTKNNPAHHVLLKSTDAMRDG